MNTLPAESVMRAHGDSSNSCSVILDCCLSRSREEINGKALFRRLPLGTAANSLIHKPVLLIAVDDQPEQIGPGIVSANIGNRLGSKNRFPRSLGNQDRFTLCRPSNDLTPWVDDKTVARILDRRQPPLALRSIGMGPHAANGDHVTGGLRRKCT